MTKATTSQVRALLAARAFLFDDPDAYLAGIDDALEATRDDTRGVVGGTASALPRGWSPWGSDVA